MCPAMFSVHRAQNQGSVSFKSARSKFLSNAKNEMLGILGYALTSPAVTLLWSVRSKFLFKFKSVLGAYFLCSGHRTEPNDMFKKAGHCNELRSTIRTCVRTK